MRGFVVALLAGLAVGLLPSSAHALDSTTWEQRNLAGIGYLSSSGVDGVAGPQTTAAVRAFQHDNGLDEDGVYGARTELALHNKVIEVQHAVGASADGAYGSGTASAVSGWQGAHHLSADGISGPATMQALGVARTVQITAQNRFGAYGWSISGQFGCLDQIYTHESGWKVYATNPSSGAYGIPQALPGTKMATAGSDWQTNPATQIHWGLDYIHDRYGTPCSAWSFWQAHNWY
uniref:aggregation-promoting factor C-terminal-like domain-containing protein n=1 Tax=Streptacidiphilus rugosus TaxID=405783 RepID=UPI000AD1A9C2|nr:peptidoglycan-binding protein [Streptacidiphilus rugosus]